MPQRWVLACVAEIPEVVTNPILIQVHVPVLVYIRVARWRLQLARRLALTRLNCFNWRCPEAPAHAQAALGVGRGSFAGLSREARGWRGLAVSIPAPAGDGAVAPHPASV